MPLYRLGSRRPRVHADAYVAPTAVLIGDVEVEAGASIWFGAVLRGDDGSIRVGPGSNVQDNVVVHCDEETPTLIGRDATVGHGALLEGCIVEEGAIVGSCATMLERSRLGAGALLAAGAVLGEGAEVAPGWLAAGVPATPRKQLSGASERWLARTAGPYQANARRYRDLLVEVER